MQVNNSVQSPNFGMALRIDKGAKKALEKCSMETIEKLQKAGADLKDTKFYHVEIGDDLSAKLTADKDAYFGLFKTKEYGSSNGVERHNGKDFVSDRILMIKRNDCGGNIAGVGRYLPVGSNQPFFNTWGVFGTYNKVDDVSKLAQVAKILDAAAVQKYEENLAKKVADVNAKDQVSNAVGSLLDTYGV